MNLNFASFSKISNLVYFHFLWAYHGGHTLFIFGHKMFSTNSFTIEYHFFFFFCAPSYSFSKLVHIDFALHTQFFFPTHTHNFPFGFSFSYTRSQIERKYTILYIHIYIYYIAFSRHVSHDVGGKGSVNYEKRDLVRAPRPSQTGLSKRNSSQNAPTIN